jgi:DNA-binding transcriptional ArsR family regulator
LLAVPYHVVHGLPDPKDGKSLLTALDSLSPRERVTQLSLGPECCPDEAFPQLLQELGERGSWGEQDVERVYDMVGHEELAHKKKPAVENTLEIWAHPVEYGERLQSAFQTYFDVFFAEEEARIRPALKEALERAQKLSETMDLPDLIEELSQGVRVEKHHDLPEVLFVPAYWSTPLLLFGKVSEQRAIYVFGARPEEASLVPGEAVPDILLRQLKAMSDPTRLRILRYLTEEPLTPTQLASRLRLRSSTVVHHLKTLRLATLVQVTVGGGKEKRYRARTDRVSAAFGALEDFLGESEVPAEVESASELVEAD